MQINDYLLDIKEITEKFIKENLGELLDFDVMSLPDEIGIIFVYRKDNNELVYIESAKEKNSTIKDKIEEYFNPEYTGVEFRNKIMKDIFHTSNWSEDEIGEEFKNINEINKSIEYIRENFKLKLIILPKNISSTEVFVLEKACIALNNPIYNV